MDVVIALTDRGGWVLAESAGLIRKEKEGNRDSEKGPPSVVPKAKVLFEERDLMTSSRPEDL